MKPKFREDLLQPHPEDLKAILRSTIAKAEGEKGAKEAKKEEGLKDALRGAVAKEPHQPPQSREQVRTNESQRGGRGTVGPFEIPEETLRSIFKEDV